MQLKFFICINGSFCVDIFEYTKRIETTTITLTEYQRLLAVEREDWTYTKKDTELKTLFWTLNDS